MTLRARESSTKKTPANYARTRSHALPDRRLCGPQASETLTSHCRLYAKLPKASWRDAENCKLDREFPSLTCAECVCAPVLWTSLELTFQKSGRGRVGHPNHDHISLIFLIPSCRTRKNLQVHSSNTYDEVCSSQVHDMITSPEIIMSKPRISSTRIPVSDMT